MVLTNNTNNTNNTDNNNSGIINDLYNTSAAVGKFKATVTFVFLLFVFICILFLVNHFLYNKEDIYDNNLIKGTVKDSTCTKNSNNSNNSNNINWDCSTNILYNINNIDYVKKNFHTNSSTYYYPDSKIDLRYNKYDHNNITDNTYSNNFYGNVIIFFSFIILLLSGIQLISVYMFKPLAAASGAGAIAGTVVGATSGAASGAASLVGNVMGAASDGFYGKRG